MNRKRIVWASIIIILLAGAVYGWREYTRKLPDLKNAKPAFSMTAEELLRAFENDDSAAGTKYNGKVLELAGKVRELEKDEKGYYTLILEGGNEISSIRCSMDTTYQQEVAAAGAGSEVQVRGVCTGFNKDDLGLGSDVFLNRCVLIR